MIQLLSQGMHGIPRDKEEVEDGGQGAVMEQSFKFHSRGSL